jgi:hypothetical protein
VKYQIIPLDVGGSLLRPRRTSPHVLQDECAARVYRAQGAGAWVNC